MSVQLRSVSGGLSWVLMFEIHSSVSSFSLILCGGFCALDGAATAPALDRMVSYGR